MFSDDLANWFPVAASDGDVASASANGRPPASDFFNCSRPRHPSSAHRPTGKPKSALPSDNFFVEFKASDGGAWVPPGTKKPKETQWVKFTVLMDDLATVYFQDANKLKFHYDFGTGTCRSSTT